MQSQDVREDALQLLDVLSERHWQQQQQPGPAAGSATRADTGGIGQDTVIGSLPESWLQHQLRLSTKLARCGGYNLASFAAYCPASADEFVPCRALPCCA